jgi:hypothetical protein
MATEIDSQEQFEYWLSHMDDALAEFFARLPEDLRAKLDYSPASLPAIEEWLLARYPNPGAIMTDAELPILDGAARYVGETFRKSVGGRWRIRLDDPKYVYHGLPELTFLEKRDTPECPLATVTTSLDRRTGKYFTQVLNGVRELVERARAKK